MVHVSEGPVLLGRMAASSGRHLPPFGRHLAFGSDPRTQMSVTWQVKAPVAAPFIRVGYSPADLGQPIEAEVRTLVTPASAGIPAEQYYLHANLTGLEPGRTYYYAVGHHGFEQGHSGLEPAARHTFATAPRGRVPFSFTAFGDQGVTDDAALTARLIGASQSAFHLHAGDISYAAAGGRGLHTEPYDPYEWDAFFGQIEPIARSVPWQIAVGNHELEPWYSPDGNGGQRARFGFPAAQTYYAFRYGNVGIVSLDANDVSYEIQTNLGYTGGRQTTWLAGKLAELRADPDVDFIVAYFHHCAYCTCISHGSDGGVRDAWAGLFDTYAVDLVINGHNHVYERTDPLRAGAPVGAAPPGSTVYPASGGTTYIVAGAAGKGLYNFPVEDSYQGRAARDVLIDSPLHRREGDEPAREQVGWSRVRYTGFCLLVIESQPAAWPGAPSRLAVRAVTVDGTQIDSVDLIR
jgi:Purple acid Phosphatase, N-terminal domain/Calcineurin-like phosphoesterase